jgi:hypothetical protein
MQKKRLTLRVIKKPGDISASVRQLTAVRPALARLSRLLILDRYGCIRACGRDIAALVDVAPGKLIGQPVKSLLPALPIHADTPGYNVAFAIFQASAGHSPVFQFKKSSGITVAVSVSLTVLETVPEYLLSLEIREHDRLPTLMQHTPASTQTQPIFHRCAWNSPAPSQWSHPASEQDKQISVFIVRQPTSRREHV